MDRAESQDEKLEALHRRLKAHSLGGHWQPRERNTKLVPVLWPWSSIRSCLMESGEVIKLGHADEATNRRTINLVNPSLASRNSTSRTLQMSVQLVQPGESAECHRHSPAALRFVVEADGTGYTNVEGEQMLMSPGDLLLTPNWTWHDHANPSSDPMIWLDVLDVHLVSFLDATVNESYKDALDQNGNYFEGSMQPIVRPDGDCRRRLGAIRPRTADVNGRAVPYAYKWQDAVAALEDRARSGPSDPYDGILLEYSNPLTGGPTMPTISCRIQRLGPGESTRPHRHMSSTIYHAAQGEGVTTVGAEIGGGDELVWGLRDCFFVPPMMWHRHQNRSRTEPAYLFSVSDRPVLESFGLYREERG